MSKALILSEISNFFASNSICATEQAKQEFLAELFFMMKNDSLLEDLPTYSELSRQSATKLAEEGQIPLTIDYTDAEMNNPAIAYYRIKGMIMGESSWWFSTKQFVDDLKAAEENPMIMSHFFHVNSGGGDTWYLDKAWQAMSELKKPSVAVIERIGASAAIYIISPAKKINAATSGEILGSIGTMISFYDWDAYFKEQGLIKVEHYASKSDLKNKKSRDLLDGKPKQFIEEELNPLQQEFEAAVRKARPKAGALEEEHPLFRGETYRTAQAIDLGLIDDQKTLAESIVQAYELGLKYYEKNSGAMRYLNNNY